MDKVWNVGDLRREEGYKREGYLGFWKYQNKISMEEGSNQEKWMMLSDMI